MGIRGFTTFVDKHSDRLLQSHQLHDTYIVLDGNNICCQLFIHHVKSNNCFGGDYDAFARIIESFFDTLKKCNVTPIIIFDGNYERKKVKTIFQRQRDRIEAIANLTPGRTGDQHIIPLFTRVMFPEIVKRLGLHVYRCELEADNEIACLAKALNCPVLSYDSDFYIFDVLYVPFKTLHNFVPIYNQSQKYWYLDCQLYKTENFLNAFPGLRREHLPLIATLLGNDYIKASVFKKFYSQLKLKRCISVVSVQQRRIRTVIEWLQTETFESAVCKILNRQKMQQRKLVAKKIDLIVRGYVCSDSIVQRDLNITFTSDNAYDKLDLQYDLDELVENCDKDVKDTDFYDSPQSSEDDVELSDGNKQTETIVRNNDKTLSSNAGIPNWFVKKHKLCEYPSSIYEITQYFFFFSPHMEDYSNKPSHTLCFKILAAINKILSKAIHNGEERLLRCVGRNNSNGSVKFRLDSYEKDVVSLEKIPNLTDKRRIDFILDVLGLEGIEHLFNQSDIPNDWKLLLLSMTVWIKNATVQINSSHISSVILCGILLKIVDKNIGLIRSCFKIKAKYSKLLDNPQVKPSPINLTDNLSSLVTKISDRESAFAMLAFIPSFQLSDRIARNDKQFDIRIVDAFAQLQCCIFYIDALNYLLNNPFEPLIVSDFFNGTFLYNMYVNLHKRTDIANYLQQLLISAPNIVNVCLKFVDIIEKLVGRNDRDVPSKRRKKNRKSKSNSPMERDDVDNIDVDNIEDDSFFDENNSYCVLDSV